MKLPPCGKVHVPDPKLIALTFDPVEFRLVQDDPAVPIVTLYPLAANVPYLISGFVFVVPTFRTKSSWSTTDPPGVSIVIEAVQVFPADVMPCVVRPAKVIRHDDVIENVVPEPLIQLPYTEKAVGDAAILIVFAVLNDISIVPILYAALIVTLDPEAGYVAAGNTAVSCANGN
jgi:hypothetical protein